MSQSFSLRELYGRLQEDQLRKTKSFSADILTVHEVLFSPFARFVDKRDVISWWLQKHQPCVFGKIAAAKGWMHYCILTDQDLQRSDQYVAELVNRELLHWKRRSFRPTTEFSIPAHGFMLLVVSQRVALASPDNNLLDFARAVLRLVAKEGVDPVHWQTLYLAHPTDGRCLKFTFTIDYFGAQADGRWWHDHRVPGGIAFTANSVGHMKWYADWYDRPRKDDWVLRQAMETIAKSADTPYGKATWLKSLPENGQPVVARLACPFAEPQSLKPALRDKDWTRYGGFLHTDHSVRQEFFRESPTPDHIDFQSWLQDFTYLYDTTSHDHTRFVAGETCPYADAIAEIGDPEDYVDIATPQIQADGSIDQRPSSLRSAFERCQDWQLLPPDVEAMLQ